MSYAILIVDDHPILRASLRSLLETVFSNCHIVEAANGFEAITAAERWQPYLIVMDIHLPQVNGLEAIRSIKAALPDTEVVVLTVYEDDAHRLDAVKAGASAYVSKSQLERDLIPTLKHLLPPAGTEA